MASLHLLILLLVTSQAISNHPIQTETFTFDNRDCRDGYTVTLNGSSVRVNNPHHCEWDQKTHHEGVKIKKIESLVANVTVPRPPNNENMTYLFELAKHKGRKDRILATAKILFSEYSSEGLRELATDVVHALITLHYDLVFLSHRHQRSSCFHPKVAGYFRNLAKEKVSTLDAVIKFIHEKQATEDATTDCPTNYVAMMEKDGFKETVMLRDLGDDAMISSFRKAYEFETNLARTLTQVFHHSENNKEIELSEFISAELLPQVTKNIGSLKNVIETALGGAHSTSDRHLKEFLFDKYLDI